MPFFPYSRREDHLGDMDFKVTGTRDGITATQMDIKVDGLSYEVLEKALNQAKEGRMHILDKILDTIPEPRADFKPHVPRIEVLEIPKDMIGAVIGPGGKIIQGIQEETGAIVTIDEIDGVGRVEWLLPAAMPSMRLWLVSRVLSLFPKSAKYIPVK